MSDAEVLIIGAGVAGLAAAQELSAAGSRVIVLEARDRLGGRIHTHREKGSMVPIELGAEFVHGKSPELFRIVDAAKLLLCDVTSRHLFLRDKSLIKEDEFWDRLNELMDQMKEAGARDRSFQDFLDSLPDTEETRETKSIASMYVEGFHAARTERIGVRGLIRANDAAERIDGDKQFRLVRGYDGVVDWLALQAKQHEATLHLNTVVQEVHWSRSQVELTCNSQERSRRFSASRVIITLPLGVLQATPEELGAVRFIPSLPEEQRSAIDCLAMGQVVKINLRFRERFWERLELPREKGRESLWELGFIHSAQSTLPTWWTFLPLRTPFIVGWVGEPDAEELLTHDENHILSIAINSLADILGVTTSHVREQLETWYLHNWSRDPFARGAYSYVPVNGLEAQATLARGVEDTLFFAGEAMNSEGHIGTVHGAITTGLRAAQEILRIDRSQ